MIASDYPFADVMWTMLVFFGWILWFFFLFLIFSDLFRRHDISGWGRVAWIVFVIVLPFFGILAYMVTQGGKMVERHTRRAQAQQTAFDRYVRESAGAGGGAAEIEKAKTLLDGGAITQAEYDTLKQKALA